MSRRAPAIEPERPPVLPPLALTMGDPAGIGPEIAILAWQRRLSDRVPPFALYADADLMRARAALASPSLRIEVIDDAAAATEIFERALPIVSIPLAEPAEAGRPLVANGAATVLSIERAVGDIARERASAVVTNPIAKSVLYQSGFEHPGHTEYLGVLAKALWPGERPNPVMMIAAPGLHVVPVTIHVALQRVPELLSVEKVVGVCRTVAAALRNDFGIARPRLAVTGLNPHAGEDGALGHEDRDIIRPAIEALQLEGIEATGPYAADTLFHAAARRTYDAAVAMYHDQALIPIKTLAFDEGVNVTLGLPFVRTSPDHGTAFGIAGKGIASPTSLIAALKLAAEMAARRDQAAVA